MAATAAFECFDTASRLSRLCLIIPLNTYLVLGGFPAPPLHSQLVQESGGPKQSRISRSSFSFSFSFSITLQISWSVSENPADCHLVIKNLLNSPSMSSELNSPLRILSLIMCFLSLKLKYYMKSMH